ncbi:SPFH domain-containing protein [Streptacidiphilus sp. N1-10]|uniref:SPFH domain-containing protein n=1 Tax=Streptacidiphilus jeojiensis TaxID=3229225 RepID=A0ABV6XI77_9ACTN
MRRVLKWGSIGTAAFGLAASVLRSVQVIPEASTAVVESFGRYDRVLYSGLHWMTPITGTVRNRLDMRSQVVPFPLRAVISQDGLEVPIEATVQYVVSDPKKATYAVASFIQAIERRTLYELSYAVARLAAEDARTTLEEIGQSIQSKLTPAAEDWGLTIQWVGFTIGETRVSPATPKGSRKAAKHESPSAAFLAVNGGVVHLHQYQDSPIGHQSNRSELEMSENRIGKQTINGGNVQQMADSNTQDNRTFLAADAADRLEPLLAQLVAHVHAGVAEGRMPAEAAVLEPIEALHAEVVTARTEHRPVQAGAARRLWRQWRTSVAPTAIAVAGSATADLILEAGHILGV